MEVVLSIYLQALEWKFQWNSRRCIMLMIETQNKQVLKATDLNERLTTLQ